MAAVNGDASPALEGSGSTEPAVTVVLAGGTQQVAVTRTVLAAMSPILHNALAAIWSRDQLTARLDHVSVDMWNVVWAFYLGGSSLVTEENVQEVVFVANMYGLTKLKEHCDALLCTTVNGDLDVWRILNWAHAYQMTNLKDLVMQMVRRSFVHYTEWPSFLAVHYDVLVEILHGPFMVCDREDVRRALIRWLEAKECDGMTMLENFPKVLAYTDLLMT